MKRLTGESFSLLVVGSAWPPETFIARLLRGLLARGFQITLATVEYPARDWLDIPGFRWLPIFQWEGSYPLRLARLIWMFLSAAFRFSTKDMQILNAQTHTALDQLERLRLWNRFLPFAGRRWDAVYFPWNSAAIGYLPLFEFGMPTVVSCRGSQVNVAPHNPQRAAIKMGLQETFERASAAHCVSQNILQEAMQFGLDEKKACVIYPAVDTQFFQPVEEAHAAHPEFRILTVGSLVWVKGLEYALLAIQKLRQDGIPAQFNIIGSGAEEARVRFTILDLGLQDCVRLLGRKSPEHVRDALQQTDVFLLSSLSEGISNAVLEAMSCAVPVVTTDCGGMREAVMDGVEGFVVPMRDPDAMASALKRLWGDSNLRQTMGAAARQRIQMQFDLERQIDEFQDLLMFATQRYISNDEKFPGSP